MNILFFNKVKSRAGKTCRRRMVITLATVMLLFMSSMAMAGSSTKYTGKKKIHDDYFAEGKVKATIGGVLWWKTGGADGWTFYTNQEGEDQDLSYADCGMVYAMVFFYTSGNALSEFRSSPVGQTDWAVTPINSIARIKKVEARFNLYDYCGQRYIGPRGWQTVTAE